MTCSLQRSEKELVTSDCPPPALTHLPPSESVIALLHPPHSDGRHERYWQVELLQLTVWHATQDGQRLRVEPGGQRGGHSWLDWLILIGCYCDG